MKLAFADTYRWVADARPMTEVTPADLLSDAYLAERAKLIDPRRAQDFQHGTPPRGGTIYLTAADESGMMISLIQCNYMGFGSGVVVPGTGVSLQNRGHGFTLDEGHPNEVAGGKRPFHTIIPGFLTKDGKPQMTFGVMGGNMQPQGHLQTLVRMLVHHQQPQAACDAPRWKVATGLKIDLEHTMAPALQAGPEGPGPPVRGQQRPLHGLRQRPVHLEAERRPGRRLRRRQRFTPRRAGRGLLIKPLPAPAPPAGRACRDRQAAGPARPAAGRCRAPAGGCGRRRCTGLAAGCSARPAPRHR